MIGLFLKKDDSPVLVGMELKDNDGVTFKVTERLGITWRYGAGAVKDERGRIRLPSEFGAYCTTM